MLPYSMDRHFNFRMSSKDKKIIEMAAKLSGLKPQTYARQKLIEAAEKDIKDKDIFGSITVNQEDWDFLLELMKSPVQANPHFKKALQDYRKTFGG